MGRKSSGKTRLETNLRASSPSFQHFLSCKQTIEARQREQREEERGSEPTHHDRGEGTLNVGPNAGRTGSGQHAQQGYHDHHGGAPPIRRIVKSRSAPALAEALRVSRTPPVSDGRRTSESRGELRLVRVVPAVRTARRARRGSGSSGRSTHDGRAHGILAVQAGRARC